LNYFEFETWIEFGLKTLEKRNGKSLENLEKNKKGKAAQPA
jgi:hypothetical protein